MDAVGSLANVALMRSDYPRAADSCQRSKLLAGARDENAVAVTRANRAYLALQMADFNLALTLAEESLALSRKTAIDERRERGLERGSRCARVRQAETR